MSCASRKARHGSELRRRLTSLEQATEEVSKLRAAVSRAYMEKVRSRMQELMENADEDRILQEAAILAERSDIQEELVRLHTHIDHFRKLLDQGGEVGKKLDFLLQELNREANTLLSKTSGVAGEGLRITELGLQMKVGDRKMPRAGAEPGMSSILLYHLCAFRLRQNHAGE